MACEDEMVELLIGTSGWSYNEWVGVFYPSTVTNKLAYYSKIFNTVEVDSTFYSYPNRSAISVWDRQTPNDFKFSLKLPRLITHEKKLRIDKGIEADLLKFLDILLPLMKKNKLGPILIQLPPSFTYDDSYSDLKAFLSILPKDLKFAVEFRNPSWLRDDVWELLRVNNVAYTIVDEPLLPPELIFTADFAFIRWHGKGKRPWYNYRYNDSEIASWVPRVREALSRTKRVYGYFNNHFRGFAVENSLKMMKMLGELKDNQSEALKRASLFIEKPRQKVTKEASMLEFIHNTG